MQTSDRVLAWRYGRALFQAAAQKGEEARVQQDLQAAQPAIRELAPALRHPLVPAGEKKRQLEAALGQRLSAATMRFLFLLIDRKRFELLPHVLANLGKLIAEKNNVAKAQVRAARALSAADQQKLKDRLQAFAGKNIELEIKEDPELIGGLTVRLGDWVLDSSLRGQLRAMKETLHGD